MAFSYICKQTLKANTPLNMEPSNFIYLISFLATASCRIYSVENPDGSYSIGLDSDSNGQTANSVLALLTKSAGYTLDGDYETPSENQPQVEIRPLVNDVSSTQSRALLAPHLEILHLIETFIQFKGELGSRIYALMSDNYDLIRSVYLTIVNKIGTLHSFTLTGIRVLRRILEFATSLMAQWQISLPAVSVDLNVGNQGGKPGASFQFNKNLFGINGGVM